MEECVAKLNDLALYMDFYIQSLVKIYSTENINKHTKRNMVSWLPAFDGFNFSRQYSEHYHLQNDGTILVIHMVWV